MEDTKSLLIMVLHQVFESEPKTVEKIFQLIHNFNNGKSEKKNYEKVKKRVFYFHKKSTFLDFKGHLWLD